MSLFGLPIKIIVRGKQALIFHVNFSMLMLENRF